MTSSARAPAAAAFHSARLLKRYVCTCSGDFSISATRTSTSLARS